VGFLTHGLSAVNRFGDSVASDSMVRQAARLAR
jgi:hypothetical protein